MTSSARARANRLNARKSTGPRTSAGRAASARNALRHGLAVPILMTPGAAARVEEMARLIVGCHANIEHSDPTRLELARRVAAAQLDLIRIREARRLLLEDPKAREEKLSMREIRSGVKRLMQWGDRMAAKASNECERMFVIGEAYDRMEQLIAGEGGEGDPLSLAEGFGNLAPQLLRLERYERRAMSRRKTATRGYDAYCRSLEGTTAAS